MARSSLDTSSGKSATSPTTATNLMGGNMLVGAPEKETVTVTETVRESACPTGDTRGFSKRRLSFD